MADKKTRVVGVVWTAHHNDTRVAGTISWDNCDPLILRLVFHEVSGDIEWMIARDLVADALRDGQAGLGDIRAKCGMAKFDDAPWDQPAFSLTLSSLDGTVTLATRIEQVIQFASEIYGIVPRGEEEVDVDSLLRELNL